MTIVDGVLKINKWKLLEIISGVSSFKKCMYADDDSWTLVCRVCSGTELELDQKFRVMKKLKNEIDGFFYDFDIVS
jgi:hypothetical protein